MTKNQQFKKQTHSGAFSVLRACKEESVFKGKKVAASLTLALAGQWIEVNFWNMFFSIVVVVLLPILLGLGVHAVVGEKLEKIKKLTGLDLREFDHAIIFKVALMVKKYLTANPVKY